MTDPTDVEPLIVTGQRRSSSNVSFPSLPQSIFVPPPYAEPNAVRDDTWREVEPCNNPEFRSRWNVDAAGASAVDAFLSRALSLGALEGDVTGLGPNLNVREFGADLRRTGRNILLGPVYHGEAGGSSVTIEHPGLTLGNWMGDVHSHPSGDPRPSSADWAGFQDMLNELALIGVPTNNRFIYIIVSDEGSPSGYSTYVYGEESDPDVVGYEVNPEAQPCP